MNINQNTNRNVDAREEVIELGVASVETHGTPKGEGEFLGHDLGHRQVPRHRQRGDPEREDGFGRVHWHELERHFERLTGQGVHLRVHPFFRLRRAVQYRVRNDLSYCVVDGHAVFLDVAADRYFHLPDQLEKSFIGYATASDRSRATVAMLIDHNILVPEEKGCRDDPPAKIGSPLRSAYEMPTCHTGSVMLALPEVMATIWRCRRRIGP